MVEEDLEDGIMIGAPIINHVSKHQGIIMRGVEVVVTIIIGIPGTTTETTVEEVGDIITEEDVREEDMVEEDIGTIETEGKFLTFTALNITVYLDIEIYLYFQGMTGAVPVIEIAVVHTVAVAIVTR